MILPFKKNFYQYITTLFFTILLILLFQCTDTQWHKKPPIRYTNEWGQFGKPFYGQVPAKFIISEDYITHHPFHYDGEEVAKKTCSIDKVRQNGDEILIFCGQKEPDGFYDMKYRVRYHENNTISIYEIVPTGVNQNTQAFFIGKYKKSDI